MKIISYYLLFVSLVFSNTVLLAQSENPPVFSFSSEYTKIIPNSPESEAMAKYVAIPVTLYSGIPNVSIPVYDIRWGNLTHSISLSYNNNGLKPAEEASRCGYGWNVNAGGVITRVVNGAVDESPYARRYDSYPNITDYAIEQEFLDSIANGKIDGEPDIYIFNFNGITGKFLYLNDHTYISCQQHLKINKIGDDFQIVTEDGTTYDFGAKERTTSHQLSGVSIPTYYSAWNLTSITSKDKKDVITFNYISIPYQHLPVFTDSYTESHPSGQSPTGVFSVNPSECSMTYTNELESISFGNNIVNFISDENNRLDILNYFSPGRKALKSIRVYDQTSSKTIKKFNLVTGYFGTNRKLKLSEVRQVDGNDQLLNKYTFTYNNESSFPSQSTRGIDSWGYYNGKDLNASLIAKSDCQVNNSLGGDRTPNYSSALIGTLNTITYPTGGTTSFEYEPNYYSDGNPQYIGYRQTKSLTTFFNNSNNGGPVTTTLNFTLATPQYVNIFFSRDVPDFTSNGVKCFTPIVTITQGSTTKYSRIINYMALETYDSTYLDAGTYTLTLACEKTATHTYATIGYQEQSQQLSPGTLGPGLRIKSITSNDLISQNNLVKRYYYLNDNGTSSGRLTSYTGYQINYTDLVSDQGTGYQLHISSGGHSGMGGALDNEFYYTKVTEMISDGTKTGKTTTDFGAMLTSVSSVVPIKEVQWKALSANTFTKAKETSYNYDLFSTKDAPGIKSHLISNNTGSYPYNNPDYLDYVDRFRVYTSSPSIASLGYYRLKSQKVITYSDSDNNTTTTSYVYNNPNYSMVNGVFVNNSKGETLQTRYLFPTDYTANTPVPNPDQIETNFNNTLLSISYNFQTARSAVVDLVAPYWTPSFYADENYKNLILANSSFRDVYFNSYRQALADRNASLTNYYNSLNSSIAQTSDGNAKALLLFQRDHAVSSAVEQMTYKKKSGGVSKLTAAGKSVFNTTGGNIPYVEKVMATELESPIDSSSFQSSGYVDKLSFIYDADLKMIQQKKSNDVPRSYIWDYNKQYPIAEVINANFGDIAYTSFEGDQTGNWSLGSVLRNTDYAFTGQRSYNIFDGMSVSGSFSTSNPYILSYWSKNGSYSISGGAVIKNIIGKTINGWTYYEHEISSWGSYFLISGNGLIDEVRLYPKGAQMNSYTYTPLVGLTSHNDAKNSVTYYNYDNFGRLSNVTDDEKNILNEYTYNYGTNPLKTGVYYSAAISANFTKQGCGSGYIGSTVTYSLREGSYSSTISQADADQKAANDIAINGQNYANNVGQCSSSSPRVTFQLEPGTNQTDIGLCSFVIRDGQSNAILLSKISSKLTFPCSFDLPSSTNGQYTVEIVPDPSFALIGFVNNQMKDLISHSATWYSLNAPITISLSTAF